MRGCGAFLVAFSLAMLWPFPAAADPLMEPMAVAGIQDIRLHLSSPAGSSSDALPAPAPDNGGPAWGDPAGLGVIAMEDTRRLAPVAPPATYPAESELADAILNGVPLIAGPPSLAAAGVSINATPLDLDAAPSGQPSSLEIKAVAPPEPGSLLLLGTGLLGLALLSFRRARAAALSVRK